MADDVRLRVEGVAPLVRGLDQLADDLRDMPVMERLAQEGAALARSYAPRRTGTLAASIRARRYGNKAVVIASAPYARVVNLRTRFMRRADLAMIRRAPGELQAAIDKNIRGAKLT